MQLIIVESPTKANTFGRFLDKKDYQVEASIGHVRDLPTSKMEIDLEHDFAPHYIIAKKKNVIVKRIKALAKKADSIILATDSDREGESISYHIAYLLGLIQEEWPVSSMKKNSKTKRIVFHEITHEALVEALKKPQELNFDLVNAQQTRRILDRIVGYKLSPLLWRKMGKRWLSAGRVQTVALRFIVEREKEIVSFKKEPYFRIGGIFGEKANLKAELIAKNEEKYERTEKIVLFDGTYSYTKTTIDAKHAEEINSDLQSDTFTIDEISEKTFKRYPQGPYTTSTLQQDAARILHLTSKASMRLAQHLYEKGLITYHRTDSTYLSPRFFADAKTYIAQKFGKEYLIEAPRIYKTKSKLAQEAHEAIRPTHLAVDLDSIGVDTNGPSFGLTSSHVRLFELIKRRALASQMKEADIKTVKVSIRGKKGYLFETSWEQILFDGFLRIYEKDQLKGDGYTNLHLHPQEKIALKDVEILSRETLPPPRYSEASLIKTLEEKGIGRPSTYAPILSTIQERNYVEKKEGRFFSTMLGKAVVDYLSSAFVDIFKIDFTAKMEDDLDRIAQGEEKIIDVLKTFYLPFSSNLALQEKDTTHIDVEEKTDEKCPTCQSPLVIRYSRFGKFYACSRYPDCKFTKSYVETVNQLCPQCGGQIVIKYTRRKRKFFGCSNYPKCTFAAWKLHQIQKQ